MTAQAKPRRLLTVRAAAAEYGLSQWQLRDAIGGGQLTALRLPNGRIYIDRRDLDATIEAWKERARADAAVRRLRDPERWANRAERDGNGRFLSAPDGDVAGTADELKPH